MGVSRGIKNLIKAPLEAAAAGFGEHKRSAKQPRLWILMYHRILPRSDHRYQQEEPGMIVEPDTLRMHMRVIKEIFTPVSLFEWISRYEKGRPLPANSCAVTFDDGWLDNYQYGFPILEEEQIPATLFVVSKLVGSRKLFWPNRVSRLLDVPVDRRRNIDWLVAKERKDISGDELAKIIFDLKNLPDEKLVEMLDEAEDLVGLSEKDDPVLMNWSQIREVIGTGLFDVGSHTRHHLRVDGSLSQDKIESEIVGSKKDIEDNISSSVDLFCYPKGAYDDRALSVVRGNYKAAVTTAYGINHGSDINACLLKRVSIHQHASDAKRKFLSRLSGWQIIG